MSAIEGCKAEGVVDVFQIVKALRTQKPNTVATVVRFRTVLMLNIIIIIPPGPIQVCTRVGTHVY